jgi:predicted transcriptional regulator
MTNSNMRFADKIEARVKPAVARQVRALAKERDETPAAIIREALEEYFARREQAANPQPMEKAA